MPATQITLCNLALANLRVPAITSFGDGTTQSNVCSQSYAEIYEEVLGEHRWRFAMGQSQLAPLAKPPYPPAGWSQLYLVPQECLLIHTVRAVGPPGVTSPSDPNYSPYSNYEDSAPRWDRYGLYITTQLTPEYSIVMDYTQKVPEPSLPPYYRRYLVACLQRTFAVAITGKDEFVERAEKDMMAFGQKARLRDSQARTPPRNIPTRLITYR